MEFNAASRRGCAAALDLATPTLTRFGGAGKAKYFDGDDQRGLLVERFDLALGSQTPRLPSAHSKERILVSTTSLVDRTCIAKQLGTTTCELNDAQRKCQHFCELQHAAWRASQEANGNGHCTSGDLTYGETSFWALAHCFAQLNSLGLLPQSNTGTFVDLGCGLGNVLYAAQALWGFYSASGYEANAELLVPAVVKQAEEEFCLTIHADASSQANTSKRAASYCPRKIADHTSTDVVAVIDSTPVLAAADTAADTRTADVHTDVDTTTTDTCTAADTNTSTVEARTATDIRTTYGHTGTATTTADTCTADTSTACTRAGGDTDTKVDSTIAVAVVSDTDIAIPTSAITNNSSGTSVSSSPVVTISLITNRSDVNRIRLHCVDLCVDMSWTCGDVVFAHSICFGPELMSKLLAATEAMRDGAVLVCMTPNAESTCPWLESVAKAKLPTSYSAAYFYMYVVRHGAL